MNLDVLWHPLLVHDELPLAISLGRCSFLDCPSLGDANFALSCDAGELYLIVFNPGEPMVRCPG